MEAKTCSICYEEEKVETLSCKHDFCESCIQKWKSEKMTCPVCRSIIVPRISFSTRAHFYGRDSCHIREYWEQIQQSERLVEFMSQLAFAKHYIDSKDLTFAKEHFLKKHVFDYCNKLFCSIAKNFKNEKKHYDKIFNILVRSCEPQKRVEIYKKKMLILFEAASIKQIEIYKSNAMKYYHSKIKEEPKLVELRKLYIDSKLEHYHQSNKNLVQIELLKDEIFVEEQFFVKTFYKEVDVSMVFKCGEHFILQNEMTMNQHGHSLEPQNQITGEHNVSPDNEQDFSDDESTPYESDDDNSTMSESDNESDDDYDMDDDEDIPLETMIVNFDRYMKKPKTDMKTYFKSGQFQKDFMWFMKNVFVYSFFDIATNAPIGTFVHSYTKTISKIFQYLKLSETIYEETLEQYIELYDFLGKNSKEIVEYYEIMKNIVEEVV